MGNKIPELIDFLREKRGAGDLCRNYQIRIQKVDRGLVRLWRIQLLSPAPVFARSINKSKTATAKFLDETGLFNHTPPASFVETRWATHGTAIMYHKSEACPA